MKDHDFPTPTTDRLHPAIYLALVCTVLWFALAIWGFASDGYTDWLLVVVSGFATIAVLVPVILSRVGRNGRDKGPGLRAWLSGDFSTWTGSSRASYAAVELLLPLAAIAVGMTAIAIVFMIEHT